MREQTNSRKEPGNIGAKRAETNRPANDHFVDVILTDGYMIIQVHLHRFTDISIKLSTISKRPDPLKSKTLFWNFTGKTSCSTILGCHKPGQISWTMLD